MRSVLKPRLLSCLQDCRPPSGELLSAIEAKWGSLDKFITTFNTQTAAVQVCAGRGGGGGRLCNVSASGYTPS
jgi:superoxide dismutase